MNANEFIRQLEVTLRKDALEKTEMYLNARKELYKSSPQVEAGKLEHYRKLRRMWQLSVRKYDCLMENLNENIFSLN